MHFQTLYCKGDKPRTGLERQQLLIQSRASGKKEEEWSNFGDTTFYGTAIATGSSVSDCETYSFLGTEIFA